MCRRAVGRSTQSDQEAQGQNISHRIAPVISCKGYQLIMCARAVAASSCSGFTISQICGIMGAHARTHPPPLSRTPRLWHVGYGDVCVGTISRRVDSPVDVDQWEWACGFCPATEAGQGESGTAVDLEASRVEFEAAWQRLLPDADRSQLSGMARPARPDGAKMRQVGTRRSDAVSEAEFDDDMHLWGSV